MGASAANAQTLQGRVLDRITQTGLSGVSVELLGIGRTLTDANGEFRFIEIRAGRYTLAVHGLGYRPDRRSIDLRADTLIAVQLEVAPPHLDSLRVTATTVTVRGIVTDKASGIELIDTEVLIGPATVTFTNAAGRFTARKIPANVPHRVWVRSLGTSLPKP